MIEHLNSLSLEQKIGQLFFIGIAGPEVDEATQELLDEVSPGGVCLFARNIKEAQQTRNLLDELRSTLPVVPFLSIDQEGGLVDRLRRIMTPMPAASKIANAQDAAELARIIAETLRILGFNMDFAPVVDAMDEERSKHTNGLFSRTFGNSKEEVTAFAGEFLQTLQTNGVIGCLKHFPGLGASQVDSHEELPVVDVDEYLLSHVDLFPYRELIATGNVRVVMAAHAAFPQHPLQEQDENGKLLPSSLSYNFVTTLLRGELRFDGLCITDDLEMGAIVKNYGIGEACKMAVAAGNDMLAICADPNAVREGYEAVLKAVESQEISMNRIDESLARIAALKSKLSPPLPFDTAQIAQLSDDVAALNDRLSR
ncbi:MAG: glycoside hydrolase family 3 protein [Chloracidobacterium sp.]|nr:glycoside hydrolase family 3 protein [Chloracidobacterium sp.]